MTFASTGCIVGEDGNFESLSGSDDGSSSESSDDGGSFPPDPIVCDFDPGANPLGKTACTLDTDCCPEPVASSGLVGPGACPNGAYPNDWECNRGVCSQPASGSTPAEGCTPSTDPDENECIFDGFECVVIGDVGHCVIPCASTADCAAQNLLYFECDWVGAEKFCLQPQP